MLEKRVGVAVVSLQYSVVVKGLEKKLQDIGYKVYSIENNLEEIQRYAEGVELYMLYLPDNVIEDEFKMKNLTFIAKVLDNNAKKVMAIGEKSSHQDLIDAIPEIGNFGYLEKPVDMDNLAVIMDRAIYSIATEDEDKEDRQKRILIVDDDPAYAKMVREWIKYKYRVDIVTAGMQAISFLLKVKENDGIDLILLDYEMPVVDGPQVLQMLRQEPATANIPVIFLTGNGSKEAVSRVMELKPNGYILKSTTRLDLIKYLENKLH